MMPAECLGVEMTGTCTESKPRNIRERKSSAAYMHAAEFGASGKRRENLAGIEQPLVVKGAFQALLLIEIGL